MTKWREEILADGVRVILGDCREVLPTLGRCASLITDPPFEKEAHTPIRRTQRSIRTGVSDALSFAAIDNELRAFVSEWAAKSCDGWFLAFCQVEAVSAWRDAMEDAGLRYKRGMAWVKPDSSPQFNGQGPAQGYECIASGWCGSSQSRWNAGGKRGVYTHNTNSPNRHGEHPTEKPLTLMKEIVGDFSDYDTNVVDPFCGSGTTGVACVALGRRFVGVEKDERWFDIARHRIMDALARPDLFVTAQAAPVQQRLFVGGSS